LTFAKILERESESKELSKCLIKGNFDHTTHNAMEDVKFIEL